jgi:hypothetical protein
MRGSHDKIEGMKALGFALVLVVAACSSATPASDCDRATAAICQKLFQCAATAAAQQYGTESNCEVQFQAASKCATISCSVGTTYHGDKFQTCVNDINALDCSNPNKPASCDIAPTDVCY